MEQRPRLLVIGAQMQSLGRAVFEAARGPFDVTTAGLTSAETHQMDVTDPESIARVMRKVAPEHVVCTAGVNRETPRAAEINCRTVEEMLYHLNTNYTRLAITNAVGHMLVMRAWIDVTRLHGDQLLPGLKHFVSISSNSAHIARTGSAAYCMSKAALSMGVRCAAREVAGQGYLVYGYEPGWLEGTPMSQAVTRRLKGSAAADPYDGGGYPLEVPTLHRIPGGMGVDPYRLARLIVRNLRFGGTELNGTLMRIDGGEQ